MSTHTTHHAQVFDPSEWLDVEAFLNDEEKEKEGCNE